MSWFDKLADKLGAFFSRGPVFVGWLVCTIIWLFIFRYIPADLAKSDFAERANFHQIFWLSVVNIFTLFYCIWISNNQIRGNKTNDKKLNLIADALAKLMHEQGLEDAAQELKDSIGEEEETST